MIFNLDIEKTMIGCILLGKQEYINKLDESDFSAESLRMTLEAMKSLSNKNEPIDLISVSDALKSKITNAIEILINATDLVTTMESAEHIFKKVKEYSGRRKLEKAAYYIIERVNIADMDGLESIKADIMPMVDIPINEFRKKSFKTGDILANTIKVMEQEYLNKEDNKLLTGFFDLDRITAGLHPEELTIIAARPGVGKTMFALNLITYLSKKKIKSVLISREMSTNQLMKRLIANNALIDGNKLRICKLLTQEDWEKIGLTAAGMWDWDLIINDELATVQDIRAYCRELKSKGQIDVLFIDYLQLCRSNGKHESRRQEIEDISRQFKEISMEFGIPVVALSQLSRDNAKNGRPPELHDLRESGSIEQDADNVIFLHVPKDTDETQDIFDIQVIVGKQRNGPTGYILLRYHKKTFKLYNIQRQ